MAVQNNTPARAVMNILVGLTITGGVALGTAALTKAYDNGERIAKTEECIGYIKDTYQRIETKVDRLLLQVQPHN